MTNIKTLRLSTPALFDFLKAAKAMNSIKEIEYAVDGVIAQYSEEQFWVVNLTVEGEVNFPLLLTLAYMTDVKAIPFSPAYKKFVNDLSRASVLKFVIKGKKTTCQGVASEGEKYNFAL